MSVATPRSFNPAFRAAFESKISSLYGKKHLSNPTECQRIIDKLDLRTKYNCSKLDIIDVNSGAGLFSVMLNYELKPRNHILIEHNPHFHAHLAQKLEMAREISNNAENFQLLNWNPFRWSTYSSLFEEKILPWPSEQPQDKIHDELLIVANWTGPRDESLIAQWISCCGARNWLMKYGKIRMVLFGPPASIRKFMSDPGFRRRNRTALKRELFTESKLIAIEPGENEAGKDYDPRVLVRDQPLVLAKDACVKDRELTVLEVVRGQYTTEDIANIEHLLSPIFLNTVPLKHKLHKLAPGAEYLARFLPESLLEKNSKWLTKEDVVSIAEAYEKWPFKPTIEETFDITEVSQYGH
ncbi:uncharacterized protein LODBEIA_P44380 [Lodderomyces beijingensis]|uniref:rRNA adenine N(6)-methyltransferase n=1 Tax=Lodderomyces beijingensis TaxID=1775926 RepID=A0ABP0ZPZ5_9ASCO